MTKLEFDSKLDELISHVPDSLKKRADVLWASGAVDKAAYENDFTLPRIILAAALESEVDAWGPFDNRQRKVIQNLSQY